MNYSVNSCGAIGNPTSNSKHNVCCGPLGATTDWFHPWTNVVATGVQQHMLGPTELFLTASHLKALSLQRAKHASLGKACKNILPSSCGGGLTNKKQTCFSGKACKNIHPASCEVIGMSHSSPCVRGKRGKEKHPCIYPFAKGNAGEDFSQLQGSRPHAMNALSIVGSTCFL